VVFLDSKSEMIVKAVTTQHNSTTPEMRPKEPRKLFRFMIIGVVV
jgi:hypothetical protein